MPVKRILIIFVAALVFTAGAQTIEYATLTMDLSAVGATSNAILFEDTDNSFNGQSFIVVANKLSPVSPSVTSMGIAGLLNHIVMHGSEIRGTMQAGNTYILMFQRAGP